MTDQLTVPADVMANVRRRWPDVADSWSARVHDEFRTLCEQYGATPRGLLSARYGFVAAVDTADGPLVLRSSPDPHGPHQAAVATALASLNAAPHVHQTINTDHGTWTVLQRVVPGTPLSEADPTTVNRVALFRPLAAMREQPPPLPGMPSIFEWLRERLEDDQLSDLRPGTAVAPADERQHALNLLTDLARDHVPGLCHGDASSGNIIASGSQDWMFIDPRGMTGEHAYDVAVLAIRIGAVHSLPNLIETIADLTQVEAGRLHAWTTVAQAARV